MISKRLLSLVEFINFEDNVIDIGCDHALLDIYLIKHGFLKTIIVSDVHKNALNSGIVNIKRENLDERIFARLGNGLEVLNEDDLIDTVLISGMGTNTILKILNNDYLNRINKLIIQSNNDHYLLRKGVCELGFKISNESFVLDNDKYYVNIVFVRGNENYSESDLEYGPILKNIGKDYYVNLKEKLEVINNNIPDDSKDKEKLVIKIKELDDLITI